MKLYDSKLAPNPRRTRIFLAEKGLQLPTEQIDITAKQHKTPEYAAINPLQRMPALVLDDGTVITESIAIPTFGIGAGSSCSGQVLVWHDLLGLIPGPKPRFVKEYANVASVIRAALDEYVTDVRRGAFPAEQHTYGMPDAERQRFEEQPAARAAKTEVPRA